MSLRFSIIKTTRTQIGNVWEDIVYELEEEKVQEDMINNFLNVLPKKKWFQSYSEAEIRHYIKLAWAKTVSDFKKVTITIL